MRWRTQSCASLRTSRCQLSALTKIADLANEGRTIDCEPRLATESRQEMLVGTEMNERKTDEQDNIRFSRATEGFSLVICNCERQMNSTIEPTQERASQPKDQPLNITSLMSAPTRKGSHPAILVGQRAGNCSIVAEMEPRGFFSKVRGLRVTAKSPTMLPTGRSFYVSLSPIRII